MFWLTKFIQRGGDLKGAIREFTRMNGRMPRTSEMNKMLQAFGTKGDFKGWTPKVIEGGKSEQKMGLGQFTKKEDIYERANAKASEDAAKIMIAKLKKDLPHLSRNDIDQLTKDLINRKLFPDLPINY